MDGVDGGGTVTLADGDGSAAAAEVAHGPLAIGAVVGRYRVRGHLGAGGMGVVYLAVDPELDREVALKVVGYGDGHSDGDGASQAALVREAQAMASLRHANVVAVHDVGVADGRVFVAMEL